MAKQQTRHQVVKNQQGQGVLVEEVLDDNLLPDATEIEKLYKLDNNILEWLKQTAIGSIFVGTIIISIITAFLRKVKE